jgi:hypothetical protein
MTFKRSYSVVFSHYFFKKNSGIAHVYETPIMEQF